MDNKDQTTGKVKEAAGILTDDEQLQKSGKADQKAGDAKEFVENAADKAKDAVDRVKDAVTKD
jgi:uncharacterized protein YjbJ (UPF0337 family)